MTITIQTIADRCIMVKFTHSTFNRYKRDKAITAQVEAQTGVKKAGNYSKKLLSECDLFDECNAAFGAAYTYYYKNTSPWLDEEGQRLLRNDLILEFGNEISTLIREADKVADRLEVAWPGIVQADIARLGPMGNPDDYPMSIRDRYKAAYAYRAVPVDFRTAIPQYELDKLDAQLAEAEKVATTHAVSVVMKPLRDALERLAEYKGGKGERWHDSAILNIEEATRQARKLNMMDDPALNTIFSEIDATMRPHYTAPELCKTDETTRAAAKQKVEDIMAKMGGIYGSV